MVKKLLLACALLLGVATTAIHAETELFVKVTEPFANVYEYLNPKSSIIQQAKKGEYFKLVYEGTSWYQVACKGKTGWIEKSSGIVSKTKNTPPWFSIIITVLLLGATMVIVFQYIKRQKHSAA